MNRYRIVLAEDHVLVRQGLKNIIEKKADLEVVGEAGDGQALLQLLKNLETDMVLLDISMPKLRGLEAARQIKEKYPRVSILVLTMHNEREYLYHAFDAGAEGYLLKDDADAELFAAIEQIRQGRHYVSPILAGEVTYRMVQANQRGEAGSSKESLTEREKQVLTLISEGKSNKEIAAALFLSVRTVEHHRANIMKKLDMKDAANLIKYAIREGYTSINS